MDDDLLTTTEAARLVPNRPHSSCIWRWCRKGLLARNGKRIRLEHVRMGGKVYTKQCWLDEYGRRLAEADAEHFDLEAEDAELVAAAPPRRRRRISKCEQDRREAIAQLERELEEAGL